MWVVLFGTVSSNDAEICNFAVVWHLFMRDGKHGVSPFNVAMALGKSADFIGIRGLPQRSFTATTEFGVFGEFSGVRVECVAVVRVLRYGGLYCW